MGNSNLTNETMRVETIKRHLSSVLGDSLRARILPHLHNGETPLKQGMYAVTYIIFME